MKKPFTLIGLGLLLFIFLALAVSCQAGLGGSKYMQRELKDYLLFRLTKELNLTADQKALLEQAVKEVQEQAQALKAERKSLYADVKELIRTPALTEGQLDALVDMQQAKITPLKDLIITKLVELHGTLSYEQKEKLVKLLEKQEKRITEK